MRSLRTHYLRYTFPSPPNKREAVYTRLSAVGSQTLPYTMSQGRKGVSALNADWLQRMCL